jgi:hypothetical protein
VTAANWSNLTVEVWIKPSNVTFTQTAFIVANDAPLSTNLGFMIAISKNAVIFRIGKTSSYYEINQPYTFAASTWYHLAGVFSGTSLRSISTATSWRPRPLHRHWWLRQRTW